MRTRAAAGRTALEVEWRLSGEVVTDLLTGNPAALGTATERAGRLGHDLSAPHAVHRGPGRRPERAGSPARVLSVARSLAAPPSPGRWSARSATTWSLLWPADEPAEVLERAEELRRLLRRVDTGAGTRVAVSPPCTALADYPAAYRRARGAVAIARLRGRRRRRGELRVARGARTAAPAGGRLGAASLRRGRLLAPVREHDAARGTALEETLRAYVANDLNTAATAAALFVHPNTVGLRVRRAEQLLGLSTPTCARLPSSRWR